MVNGPLRLALNNDFQVVSHGLRAMLAPFTDRVVLAEVATAIPVEGPVDVTLLDTFGGMRGQDEEIDELLSREAAGKVVIYSWNMHPQLVYTALSKGCSGYLSKELGGEKLVDVLERISEGEVVVSPKDTECDAITGDSTILTWPGKEKGLSPRESETVIMIVQGFTNNDIAEHSYVTINSVKSYIRSAYRKVNVERRSQAVRWGMENGMVPIKDRVKFG